MEKNYKLNLNIFDMDKKACKNSIINFLNKIDLDKNDKIIIEFVKNNTDILKNINNISNVIFLSKKLSKYNNNISKIIIYTNNKDDYFLKNVIGLIQNILSYDIEEILEFKKNINN
jgi:hypothetical protein